MRINVAILFLLIIPVFVQAQSHENKEEKTKEEIQKLFSDLNEAIVKTELMFVKNASEKVTDVVLRLGSCQDSKATKIE